MGKTYTPTGEEEFVLTGCIIRLSYQTIVMKGSFVDEIQKPQPPDLYHGLPTRLDFNPDDYWRPESRYASYNAWAGNGGNTRGNAIMNAFPLVSLQFCTAVVQSGPNKGNVFNKLRKNGKCAYHNPTRGNKGRK